jgi:fumarate hydratase class II
VYVAAHQSQGNALEQVELLSQRLDHLMDMLAQGLEIDRDNVKKREEANRRLVEIRNKLLAGMADQAEKALPAS